MNTFLNKLKLLGTKILYLFPSRIPIGMEEFDNWAKDILTTYGWPDNGSFRFALATMIINQDNKGWRKKYVSKYAFSLALHSSAAKQIAGEYFRLIKDQQKADAKAAEEAAKQPVEATTLSVVASNENRG